MRLHKSPTPREALAADAGGDETMVERARQERIFADILARTDGVVARYLNKRLSFPLSRLLLTTRITPNHITVVNFFIGLTGCVMLLSPDYSLRVLGALMIQVNSVLDGCDGEVARLKGLSSKLGAWLDTITDDVLNNAMYVCLFVGLWLETGWDGVLKLGLVTSLASLGMSFFIYDFLIRHGKQNAGHYRLAWNKAVDGGVGAGTCGGVLRQGWFDYVKVVLKRDFFILVVLACVVLDVRLFLIGLASLPIWIGFCLYAASYVYGMRQKACNSRLKNR